MSPGRIAYGLLLAMLMAFLGWRVIAAEQQRRAPPFEGTPAERLARAPLDGDAFADMAVAEREGKAPDALLPLHEIAARRDPRDLRIRAWLADQYVRTGDYRAAIAQIDVLLKLGPEFRAALPPMLAAWADDPAFADALADKLREKPSWARAVMAALGKEITRPGANAVFAALRDSGDLDETGTTQLLDALMRAGRWDLAHAHWSASLEQGPGRAMPLLYNGNFEQKPTQKGFDWRTGSRPGSYTEFEPAEGARGNAAHVVFLGRPVEHADLEQPLALPAGSYTLRLRSRAVALRSDQGMRWSVTCHGQSRPLASSEPLVGTFAWREVPIQFEVPEDGCPGQWLRLVNPSPRGSARMVSGDIWFDDMEIFAGGGVASPPIPPR